jgi:HEAT repeat protein
VPDFFLPASAGLGEAGLFALILIVALLFLGTLGLSAYALIMRSIHTRREKELKELADLWLKPVLGAIADPEQVPAVQQLVDEDDHVRFLNFVIEYTRRVRGSEKEVLRDLARPFLPAVERASAGGTEVRAWAVQVLGTLGLPQYEREVLAALDDPAPLVAMIAARSLARRDTPEYAPAVLSHLDRFGGWSRMFLASMLAAMGPSVSEDLRKKLADESAAPHIRAVIAEALLMQGDFLAGDPAADVVRTSDDTELLASCLRLLAAVGRPEHADLVRPLCDAEDPVVRAQALRALGPLGDVDDVPVLIEAMDDEEPWPALYAARGARDAGGREVLASRAASEPDVGRLADQVLHEEDGE